MTGNKWKTAVTEGRQKGRNSHTTTLTGKDITLYEIHIYRIKTNWKNNKMLTVVHSGIMAKRVILIFFFVTSRDHLHHISYHENVTFRMNVIMKNKAFSFPYPNTNGTFPPTFLPSLSFTQEKPTISNHSRKAQNTGVSWKGLGWWMESVHQEGQGDAHEQLYQLLLYAELHILRSHFSATQSETEAHIKDWGGQSPLTSIRLKWTPMR